MEETGEDDGAILVITGRTCRCDSKTHKRVSHSDCPLNPKNKNQVRFLSKGGTPSFLYVSVGKGFFCINFNPSFDLRVSFAASDTVAIKNRLFCLFTSSFCI